MKASGKMLSAVLCGVFFSAMAAAGEPDSGAVRKLFAKPTRDYSTGPLWVWNDRLTEAQVRDTMRDLAGQDVKQVFVHPRPGLMTPYLSTEWFHLWKAALDEATRLDMNVWIYDENSYPSGFAGGWVPETMPESRGRGLFFRDVKGQKPSADENTLGVFDVSGGGAGAPRNVATDLKRGAALPAGDYLVAEMRRAGNSPWHGNRCYVDLLYPGVTEKFLDITLGAYQREIGREFGRRVPGSFTDEPELRPAGGMAWTQDLPAEFQKRWGYSLPDNLAALARPAGDWRRVRHNYYHTLNQLFVERWAKPYAEYCDKLGLEMTGHYWEHEWPNCGAVPDNMSMYAWQQRPAIDTLMNQYQENTHAQFGNARAVRELNSIANQLGKKRTLCEVYGAGGWDLRFEDMKRIGDWLGVLGVRTFDQHLSYVTLRGARKRDHPQSFSYHEPWWDSYHVSASYLSRLTVAVSAGEQLNRILVIEPTTTAWMYQGDGAALETLGNSFFKLLMSLESAQVEYDIGCEDVMARKGSVRAVEPGRAMLRVGMRDYDLVVLPPRNENLNSATAVLLEQFVRQGGTVAACDTPPTRIDGAPSERMKGITSERGWQQTSAEDLAGLLTTPGRVAGLRSSGFSIRRAENDGGILFHMRRQLVDGELLLLVNSSISNSSAGEFLTTARGVEEWNLNSGKTLPYVFKPASMGVQGSYSIPPSGSLLLFLSREPLAPARPALTERSTLAAKSPLQARRVGPNVLTLDYVDVTAGGETKSNLYFYQANQFAWQRNGMPRNPWDSAVQFKDELITKQFPRESGFEASYRFNIEGAVPGDLAIVIERADLYSVTCNGKPVATKAGNWWLDKAFARIGIAREAQTGANVVKIKAAPFTMLHELEPAYVLGDFALEPADKGFVIKGARPLTVAAVPAGAWSEQGLPFYSAGVAYERTFQAAKTGGRFFVSLPSWYGAVAKVRVNGKLAGHIVSPPWECEVTDAIKNGDNAIEVVLFGTLKNTLGPHHGNPPLGSAWPAMFQNGGKGGLPAGRDYSTVKYGLFAPFELVAEKPAQKADQASVQPRAARN